MNDPDERSPRKVVAVPTSSWRPGDAALLGELVGTVHAQPAGPGACRVWVEREDGEIIPVIWPAGYRARLDPFELLDATGTVVAVPGTPIDVGGGLMPTDPTDPTDHGGIDEAFYVMDELPPL